MRDHLDVDDFLEGDAWSDVPKSRMRGRPQDIDGATLRYRRDHFVTFFEHFWCEIGFQLQMATTIEEIRKAFAPIPILIHGEVKIFVTSVSGTMGAPELRKMRGEIRTIVDSKRITENEINEQRAHLQQAKSALETCGDSPRFQPVGYEYAKRESRLTESGSKVERLVLRERELRQKLEVGQASFAQRELLKFILSQRHSLEPRNFANAAAGLPEIGWRRSVKRCKEMPYGEDETMRYRVFKAICRALAFAKSQEVAMSDGFRSWLMNRSRSRDETVSELKRNWYFLRRALEATTRPELISSAELPFRITAEYLRAVESAVPADRIFAKDEALH